LAAVGEMFGRRASHAARIDDGRQEMQPIVLLNAWPTTFLPLGLAKA
jgi:hypothetical protein